MEQYKDRRKRSEKASTFTGVLITLAVHVLALTLISFKGLSYLYPPPEEETFLIDFSQEEEIQQPKYGREPVSEKPDPKKDISIVQRSTSPVKADIPNETPATVEDDFGDVPVPTPEPETPRIDPRASFPGMSTKESNATTPHVAADSSAVFKAGQADGNTKKGVTEGKPNAQLKGREVEGELIRPKGTQQNGGTVVVTIWVDPYGYVRRAQAGAPGTSVDDAELWNMARNAAMKTHFDSIKHIDENTPPLQEGRITYYFKLK